MAKIPKNAKRVFKGVIYDVYQWRQKMFDGTYRIFEMLSRPDTVQVIAIYQGKVLIAKQKQPGKKWFPSLFGGRVDPGELPLAAAKRELLEETGLISRKWELFKSYSPHQKMKWSVYYYIAHDCQRTGGQKLDAGERIIIRKVNFKNFLKLLLAEKFHAGELTSDVLRMRLNRKLRNDFQRKLGVR